MSFLGVIFSSFYYGFWVMLRTLPVLILTLIALSAPIFAIQHIAVVYTVIFIGLTIGLAYIFVTMLRAGLASMRATDTPTFDGLVKATLRMFFVFFIVQFIFFVTLQGAVVAYYFYVLLPSAVPEAWNAFDPEAYGLPQWGWLKLVLFLTTDEFFFRPPEVVFLGTVFTLLTAVIGAIIAGLFGVPMAAASANAVQHSPQNDLIFGFGSHFFSIAILQLICGGLAALVGQSQQLQTLLLDPSRPAASIALITVAVLFAYFYLMSVPIAAMALGYKRHRQAIADARAAEISPIFDPEEHKEEVKNLRRARQSAASGTAVYVPKRQGSEESGDPEDGDEADDNIFRA